MHLENVWNWLSKTCSEPPQENRCASRDSHIVAHCSSPPFASENCQKPHFPKVQKLRDRYVNVDARVRVPVANVKNKQKDHYSIRTDLKQDTMNRRPAHKHQFCSAAESGRGEIQRSPLVGREHSKGEAASVTPMLHAVIS